MTTLLAIGIISTIYLMIVGFTYPLWSDHFYKNHSRSDANFIAFWTAIVPPVMIPICLGALTANWFRDRNHRPNRLQRKQAKEIEEAKHEAELARVKRIAHEELDKELELVRAR